MILNRYLSCRGRLESVRQNESFEIASLTFCNSKPAEKHAFFFRLTANSITFFMVCSHEYSENISMTGMV